MQKPKKKANDSARAVKSKGIKSPFSAVNEHRRGSKWLHEMRAQHGTKNFDKVTEAIAQAIGTDCFILHAFDPDVVPCNWSPDKNGDMSIDISLLLNSVNGIAMYKAYESIGNKIKEEFGSIDRAKRLTLAAGKSGEGELCEDCGHVHPTPKQMLESLKGKSKGKIKGGLIELDSDSEEGSKLIDLLKKLTEDRD